MAKDQDNQADQAQRKNPWTVMIFMVAEPLPEWADLSELALKTVHNLTDLKLPDWLRIRVHLHTSNGVDRWTSGPEGLEKRPRAELQGNDKDLTDGHALSAFLRWALRTANHKDKDNSMLVMWGHAYPFGIGFADTGTGVDALDFAELSKVLDRIQAEVKEEFPGMDATLDILGFDACDLATIELAQHFSPYAKHLVASQIPIPLPGWPYEVILKQLIASRGDGRVPMLPRELGSYIVRTYCSSYQGKDNAVSLSLLSLQQAGPVFDQTRALARRLLLALDGDTAETDMVARLFDLSQTYRDKPFVDAADLCENLVRYSNDSSVRHAAGELGNLLTVPVHTETARWKDQQPPFILECGRNAHDTAKLHGVSLYAPSVAIESHDWRKASIWYAKFNGRDSKAKGNGSDTNWWGVLVETLAQSGS